MKLWNVAMTAAILLMAASANAQSRPVAFEVGVVQGIIFRPYVSVGMVAAPWSVRVSGAAYSEDCSGLQLNAGRVIRDSGNAKHTLGVMFARFRNGCWYGQPALHQIDGQYFGVVYDFQVKGFFVEVGPGIGARNPVGSELGLFSRVYGQLGYVHRFGKKYTDDDAVATRW